MEKQVTCGNVFRDAEAFDVVVLPGIELLVPLGKLASDSIVKIARRRGSPMTTPGEHRIERRLAAILAADVAGYSRLMGADEEGTLAQLKAPRRAMVDPKIIEHGNLGR
jgi:class 3 adenylate cyclase